MPCCGYTLTDFPISIRLTSLALGQSNDCPSASKATLMNMDKYFMCIYYERLRNHNKAKHNKTVCIFLGIYCIYIYYIHCEYDYFLCTVSKVSGAFRCCAATAYVHLRKTSVAVLVAVVASEVGTNFSTKTFQIRRLNVTYYVQKGGKKINYASHDVFLMMSPTSAFTQTLT